MVTKRKMTTPLELFENLLAGRKKVLRQGETLFQPGDSIQHIYVVCQGKLKLTRCSADGNPVTLQLADAGEILAEASLFHQNYHCMAQVESRSAELRYFERHTLMEALGASPDASMSLLQVFAQQIRRQRTLLEIRNIRAAKERIYTYFLLEADANQQVRLPLSLKDTAHQLGLAHETFYRELKRLADEGKLVRKNGLIQLY